MNRWRVGEDRGSKEMDGCPLTTSYFLEYDFFGVQVPLSMMC
jgi:hypothetical protein